MFDWAEDITLISVPPLGATDESGNVIESETKTDVRACKFDIMRNEFYQASQSKIRLSYMFLIHSFEYENQEQIEYNGLRYSVVRVFQKNADEIELYVERKVGD